MRPKPWRGAVLLVVALAVGWAYLGDRPGGLRLVSHEPDGYYGLLTDAFASGQLYLKIIPDPALLRLANPYAGPQGAERPHDTSFYRGHFYLYYGITPEVVLLPWRLLTGTFLTEAATVALFCYGGFLLGGAWLLRLQRSHFPDLATPWLAVAGLAWGFGSPVFCLSHNDTFYAIPIAAGFLCLMLELDCVDRALRAARPGSAAAWLAGASLAGGLAVGARPDYVTGLAALLLPAGWLWRQGRGPARKVWLAALGPAAAVGCGLALYNYRRFGNPLEFGMQYSMTSFDLRGRPLLGLQFVAKNLRLYLLRPADLIRYYPFFDTNGKLFGILPHLPLAAAAVLFPLTVLRPARREDPAWRIGGLFLLGAALANFGTLCLFFGGEDRYLNDFAPAGLLLGCLVLFATAASSLSRRPLARPAAAAALGLAAVWTLANGAAYAWSRRPVAPARLEAIADSITAGIERLAGVRFGPVEFRLEFPSGAAGRKEPLVSSGNSFGAGDIVYVAYPDDGHVQFGFFHLGLGGPCSDPIPVDYRRPHTVTVRVGSLYPPARHPLFRGWTDAQIAALHRQLEIDLDGRPVLSQDVDLYPATPGEVHLAANPIAADVADPRFTGTLLGIRRLPVQPPDAATFPPGPLRLVVRLPSLAGGAPQPLVCTGRSGAGDVLYVQTLDDGRIRFGHDSWGSSDLVSDPIEVDRTAPHSVDVEMGSLYPPSDPAVPPELRRRLGVWLDGRTVFDTPRPFNPSRPDEVLIGVNPIGASSSTSMFSGTILACGRAAVHPFARGPEIWGAVALTVRFPNDATGLDEPLVTTGAAGADDIVYVSYVDAGHIRLGYDHFGAGILSGPTVAIDYRRPHRLEVALGSLFPPDAPALRGRLVQVRLDGRVVLSAEGRPYPSTPDEVAIGRNDVDASHCRRVFSGQILARNRLP